MNLIKTFLIILIIFIIISIFFNCYYILKIKKYYIINNINNNNAFFNTTIKNFLLLYNLLLLLLFILSLSLDIVAISKKTSLNIAEFIAYLLLIINMLYFIFSTFSFWYFNLLYQSFLLFITKNEFIILSNSVNLSNIISIKKQKFNIILINYGEYNDELKIHTLSKNKQKKIFSFLNENIKNKSK